MCVHVYVSELNHHFVRFLNLLVCNGVQEFLILSVLLIYVRLLLLLSLLHLFQTQSIHYPDCFILRNSNRWSVFHDGLQQFRSELEKVELTLTLTINIYLSTSEQAIWDSFGG